MTSFFFEDRGSRLGSGCLSMLSGSLEAYTNAVFTWWLRNISQRVDAVLVVGFFSPPSHYESVFEEVKGCQYVILDGHTDPLGWYSDRCLLDNEIFKLQNQHRIISVKDDLLKIIEETLTDLCTKRQCTNVALAIDGLTSLLRHQSIGDVCHLLNELNHLKTAEVQLKQAICMIDTDTIERETVGKLNYYGSVIIQLHEDGTDAKGNNVVNIECEVITKKKSGKVQRQEMLLLLTHDWKLQRVTNTNTKIVTTGDSSKNADPTADIPFRLQLSDAEKEARAQVNLPYTYNQQRKTEHLTRSVGEGKVFYQPDEVDDFDDEDPDDDLDI